MMCVCVYDACADMCDMMLVEVRGQRCGLCSPSTSTRVQGLITDSQTCLTSTVAHPAIGPTLTLIFLTVINSLRT